jgi:hypothetical protein
MGLHRAADWRSLLRVSDAILNCARSGREAKTLSAVYFFGRSSETNVTKECNQSWQELPLRVS